MKDIDVDLTFIFTLTDVYILKVSRYSQMEHTGKSKTHIYECCLQDTVDYFLNLYWTLIPSRFPKLTLHF